MTQQTRSTLTPLFADGQTLLGSNLADFIDSALFLQDTSVQTMNGNLNVPVVVTPTVSAGTVYAATGNIGTVNADVANIVTVSASAVWHNDPYAELYVAASASISGAGAGTFALLSANSSAARLTGFTSPSVMRLTYSGTKQANFLVRGEFALGCNRTGIQGRIQFRKNGAAIASSTQHITLNAAGRTTGSIQCVIDLSATNYVEPYITTDSTATDVGINVDSFNMTVIPINWR